MPDDLTAHAKARGAEPVTIRASLDGGRLQRHAAHRLPAGHPEMHPIDQAHAQGRLTDRQYQNACAVLRLYDASGLGRSKGVAEWTRINGRHHTGEDFGPEDEWRALIRDGGVGMAAVAQLVAGEVLGNYVMGRAAAHLDTLNAVAARWDGEMWAEDR